GSGYLVAYPTSDPHIADAPALDNRWFGSQALYALLDERLGDWRLAGGVSALRTKLAQAGDPALAAIDGSFVEGTLRASWRRTRTWRLDGRYRARIWADHSRAQRAEALAEWRPGPLDLQARVGLDAHHGAAIALAVRPARADLGAVSPGKLAAAHAAFEAQCERCHVPFGGVPQRQCLACHTDLARRIARGVGFHPTVAVQPCTGCHKEHRGRDAATPAPPSAFDHRTTGFALDGDHARIACERCH